MSAAPAVAPSRGGPALGSVAVPALLVLWVALEASDVRRRPTVPPPPEVAVAVPVPDPTTRYLLELAIGGPQPDGSRVLHRWQRDVDVRILGAPTEEDRRWVEEELAELSGLTGRQLRLTEGRPEIEIHFAAPVEFPRLESSYGGGRMGFYRLWWAAGDELSRARILIPRAGYLEPARRRRLLVENLARSLGLYLGSSARPDSVFYAGGNWDVVRLAEIDREVVRRLYSPVVAPGMGRAEVARTLAARGAEGGR